jgi:hypothetical protein
MEILSQVEHDHRTVDLGMSELVDQPTSPYTRYRVQGDKAKYLILDEENRHGVTVYPGDPTSYPRCIGWYVTVLPDQTFLGTWPFTDEWHEEAITAGLFVLDAIETARPA